MGERVDILECVHVVLDIETLAKCPAAVVGSIAVVPVIGTGAPFDPRAWDVNIRTQPERAIDASTVHWWLRQSDVARGAMTHPRPCGLKTALTELAELLDQVPADRRIVWTRGDLDTQVLRHAYEAVLGRGAPWRWWAVRDVRTACDAVGRARPREAEHTALGDARADELNVRRFLGLIEETRAGGVLHG
jgi:hypothetical protein